MIIKEQFHNELERAQLLDEYSDIYLIEEQDIIEGKFLIFTTIKPLSEEVEKLKLEDLNNKEAIADLYVMSMGV